MSRDLLILVDEAAEAVAPSDLVDLGWRATGEWSGGRSLIQGAVWPMAVVMAFELAEYGCSVSSIDDQEAVEEFAADRSDEALGDRVRPWCPHRRLNDPYLDRGEDRVEGSGELAVAVADEEPEALVGVVEVHEQVARLLCEPGSGRMGGDAQDVDSAGGVFDNEERVKPLQRMVSRWNRSQAKIASACARRNCDQVGPARRGAGSNPAVRRIFQTVEAPLR